jgi:ribose 5-phosphate isomerase B
VPALFFAMRQRGQWRIPRCRIGAMKIALGADHAGYELKNQIKAHLLKSGIEVHDEGTNSGESVDYPDFARAVAHDVHDARADLGILVCGSGIGMAIAANKVEGVRAANVSTEYEAQMSREHNNANVLTLGARILNPDQAFAIVDKWLKTQFAGGRHERRVEKISEIEKAEAKQAASGQGSANAVKSA